MAVYRREITLNSPVESGTFLRRGGVRRFPESRVVKIASVAVLVGGVAIRIAEEWRWKSGKLTAVYAVVLVMMAVINCAMIRSFYERRLLASLVVSCCALAVMPAVLIAPSFLDPRTFWFSLGGAGLLLFFADGPLHMLDMISGVLVVPLIWLECSPLAYDRDTASIFHYFLFFVSLPLIFRYIYWRFKYGWISDIPDPEDE